ncbi:hypothetical protein PIB30_031444 [Stylosanthes scabra]|uniref:RWP-RK domain-containing protein n=1 Tax=Stylosanthes scabra TaxID=79078 RepID=A0ABU6SC41_9FABA|nr:hypothetical protein [Stylosanthes scabra]
MDSSLTILLVFNNTIQPELFRSVHVYCRKLLDGDEREEAVVEREFVLSQSGSYMEMNCTPILTSLNLCVADVCEGYKNGVWLCVFAFHAHHTPQFKHIPSILLLTRNSKLKAIPNLLNDLQIIYKLELKAEVDDDLPDSAKQESQRNGYGNQSPQKVLPVFDQDLNCLPFDEGTTELIDDKTNVESLPGFAAKKRRAQSDHIAKLALPDLVKYFDLPIVEASRSLNIGLTVLKRKCREFGIPRWPHRKIKSLDNLIHDLEEEAKHQESKDKVVAMGMVKRQRMLECEKENIEKKPFMDIQTETKRFRQDMFKRRYRARAVERQSSSVSST